MTRVEFLKQLEYLLQDIDDRDRQDALDYYRDYMDEAGIMESDTVEHLLESPEKIAMSLRISLNDDVNEHIESGDQGFRNMHVEDKGNIPEVYGASDDAAYETVFVEKTENPKSSLGKILLIAAICLIGLVFGIFGVFIGLIFAVAGSAIGCLIGGIALFVMSLLHMVISVPQGIFMMGAALLLIAVGIVLVMLTVVIFKRWIPWLIRSVVNIFRKIFHKNGGGRV